MGLMRKVEIKGKELRKRRGIKERNEIERKKNWKVLMKLGNKMCMPFCCDDCVYFNILTCLVSRNLDQGAQYLKILKNK